MKNKKIIVSVSNDLSNDQRVHRICNTLLQNGYDVLLLGRKLNNSCNIENRGYECKRLKILFNKGFLFYAALNIRFFFFFLFNKTDFFLSNDLDTLLCNVLAAKIKRKKLLYDSHELFTEVPELQNKKIKKHIWQIIEKNTIKYPTQTYTVCSSIANYYNNLYGINMEVIRNLPLKKDNFTSYNLRSNILIYQGALNKDRGIELLIEAMQYISNYKLYIAGRGDIEHNLKQLTNKLNLSNQIIFTGHINFSQLHELTSSAKLGFSIEQGTSLNYQYALPNKLFDYIQAGTPTVCSDLPEMSKIIKEYKVGITTDITDIKSFAKFINTLLQDELALHSYHNNCIKAAKILNWENEELLYKEKIVAQIID